MTEQQEFKERYGPWAVIAGASNGVGAEAARMLAERGLNVVLVSRRQQALDEVAAQLSADTGVETRAVAIDLATLDATERFVAATEDLDVGFFMYCPGSDVLFDHFLDRPDSTALELMQRNCVAPMRLCHHFGGRFVERGRGGIVLLSSAAGEIGAPHMAVYGATKAFDTVFGEGLWCELSGKGIDVLTLILGATDTPALRQLLTDKGTLSSPEDEVSLPNVVSSRQVAEQALVDLTNGPTRWAGEHVRESAWKMRQMPRSEAVQVMRQTLETGIMKDGYHE